MQTVAAVLDQNNEVARGIEVPKPCIGVGAAGLRGDDCDLTVGFYSPCQSSRGAVTPWTVIGRRTVNGSGRRNLEAYRPKIEAGTSSRCTEERTRISSR